MVLCCAHSRLRIRLWHRLKCNLLEPQQSLYQTTNVGDLGLQNFGKTLYRHRALPILDPIDHRHRDSPNLAPKSPICEAERQDGISQELDPKGVGWVVRDIPYVGSKLAIEAAICKQRRIGRKLLPIDAPIGLEVGDYALGDGRRNSGGCPGDVPGGNSPSMLVRWRRSTVTKPASSNFNPSQVTLRDGIVS
jgi:hypothetical protein